MQTILNVPEISCDHCARTVTEALTPVDGVQQVAVNVPRQQVTVEFDELAVEEASLRVALADAGYPAEERARPSQLD